MEIRRCLKCMHNLEPGEHICPSCGQEYGYAEAAYFALKPGTILNGTYLVGEMLGQGGFGITYIGFNLQAEQKVAIKEYFPMGTGMVSRENGAAVVWYRSGIEEGFDSFLQEARKMAKLDSIPGVVGVKSVFLQNETAYIVMDFVEGKTLLSKLQREGPMDFATCVSMLTPIIQSLAEVHKHGIVHRDISPDNIMVQPDGRMILLDLGAAQESGTQGVRDDVQSSQLVAKHGFSPFEQYRQKATIGPQADVYSMAATIYYSCTGILPPSAIDRVAEDTLVCRPNLTDRQFDAVATCMAVMPQDRPKDMEAMLRILTKAMDQKKTRKQKPRKPKAKTPSKRKRIKLLPIAAAAAACVVFAAVLFLKGVPAETPTEPVELQATESSVSQEHSEEELLYQEAGAWEAESQMGRAAIAFGKLGDYKDARARSLAIWEAITPREPLLVHNCWEPIIPKGPWVIDNGSELFAIRNDSTAAARENFPAKDAVAQWTDLVTVYTAGGNTIGLKSDGTVVHNRTDVIIGDSAAVYDVSGWTDIVDLSGESCRATMKISPNSTAFYNYDDYVVGLKSDGTVLAVGNNDEGQCDVSGWTDIVAIATDQYAKENITAVYDVKRNLSNHYTVGLKYDGTVVISGAYPKNWNLTGWTDIVKIRTGGEHIAGLRRDGTVVSTLGDTSGWKDITDIDAGPYHVIGLRADGTVAATGNNSMFRHLTVDTWTDMIAISSSSKHTVGLNADGRVFAVGYNNDGRCTVSGWTDIVAIEATEFCTIGLKADGTIVCVGESAQEYHMSPYFTDIKMPTKCLPVRNGRETLA